MFIGHFALGFAGKPAAPGASLPWLLLAPMWLDVIWPVLVLAGVEHAELEPGNTAFTPLDLASMPWSHSLAAALVWSVVLALLYRARRRDLRGALVVGALVASHWVLDWITHGPDLQIVPGDARRVGLGLWQSIPGTLVVELALFAIGVGLYVRATAPVDRVGRRALLGLVTFLLVSYAATAFGPLPPTLRPLLVAMLVLAAVLLLWGQWIERHRANR